MTAPFLDPVLDRTSIAPDENETIGPDHLTTWYRAMRPVVVDDAVAIKPIMLMSLTFDHRAADGMVAFQHLARVREHLEALPPDLDPRRSGC